MRITKDTVISTYECYLNREHLRIYPSVIAAAEAEGVSPRAIQRSIDKRTYDRNHRQWSNAVRLIWDLKQVIGCTITQEEFDTLFEGIENLEEI